MFNNYNDPKRNKLENIIRDYFINHQETESTFLNGFKQLNQLRIQTQAQNWSNFLIKLHQIQQIQQPPLQLNNNCNNNNNNFYNPLFKISNNNNTTSITIQPSQQSTPIQQKIQTQTQTQAQAHHTAHNNNNMSMMNSNKSRDEYKCELNECNKVYTTKGNLNRHLKDFHGLNSDLSPIQNGKKCKNNMPHNMFECDLCEQSFIDNESLKNHTFNAHAMNNSNNSKDSAPPPKPPKPPSTQTKSPINTIIKATISSLPAHAHVPIHNNIPSFPALMHLKNNNSNNNHNNNTNKAPLSLPIFNLRPNSNQHGSNLQLNAKLLLPVPQTNGNANTNRNTHNKMNGFPMSMNTENNNNNNVKKRSNDSKYNGLDILLQAVDALDKESSNANQSNANVNTNTNTNRNRKRKYSNSNGANISMNRSNGSSIATKRRKINNETDVRIGNDPRIKADFESGICSLCNRTQKQKNTSNYNWINHLQSDHKYKCNVMQCKCRFTQKQYLNDHTKKMHP